MNTKVEIFTYGIENFISNSNLSFVQETKFGKVLANKFKQIAALDGVMRFRCKDQSIKFIFGPSRSDINTAGCGGNSDNRPNRYVVLLNLGRAKKRWSTDNFTSVSQQPLPEQFNFSKCSDKEIMFAMQFNDEDAEDSAVNLWSELTVSSPNAEDRNVMMVNVSPIGEPSCILVPDRKVITAQVLTCNAAKLAVHTLLLSGNPYLRVGFNGLCALSSVNHLHFHVWNAPFELYTETTTCKPISQRIDGRGALFMAEGPYASPLSAFVVDLASFKNDVNAFSEIICAFCDELVEKDIPHSLHFTWGRQLSNNIDNTIRCFIWPRKKTDFIQSEKSILVAMGELAGYILVTDEETFDQLSWSGFEKEVADQATLRQETFTNLLHAFERILADMHL